ncbi:MAG: laccase domain-containing protein [Candidatus Uhrbacteria bacterium]|nr:laccase domain-containing protein [Candidatus Uhrbacteria bacterium]
MAIETDSSGNVRVVRAYQPVYERDLFGGKAKIIVFGALDGDWNYAGVSVDEINAKNPVVVNRLLSIMDRYNIKRALVPKPSFNAKVVTDVDLPNELLPNFFRGADADGVILEQPGDAYFLASADCLATALFDPHTNMVAALHCGRDAVIDRNRLDSRGAEHRENESVIDAAIKMLDRLSCEMPDRPCDGQPIEMQVFLAAGIRPEKFEHNTWRHPLYANLGIAPPESVRNMGLIDHLENLQVKRGHLPSIVTENAFGRINLFALVRHQLDAHGVTQIEEDEFDTATSTDSNGNFLFHSNRRDRTLRNLVVIKRN